MVQRGEEVPDRGVPFPGGGAGRGTHREADRFRDLGDVDAQIETGLLTQAHHELLRARRRRIPGEQVVGDRSEGELVQSRPVGGSRAPGPLRRLVGTQRRIFRPRHAGDMLRDPVVRGLVTRGADGVPVRDLHRHGTIGSRRRTDPDRLRGEMAMGETLAVGVLEHLAHITEDLQAPAEVDLAGMVVEPMVQPHQARVPLVDQAATELIVVDDIDRPDQPVVVEPAHHHELVVGERPRDPPLRIGGVRLEADARGRARLLAGGFPVLPVLALGDRAAVQEHPGAHFALPALDQADPLEKQGQDLLLLGVDGTAAIGGALDEAADPRQPRRGVLQFVQAEQAEARGLGHQHLGVTVVEEHGLLHPRHDPLHRDLRVPAGKLAVDLLELRGELLRLAAREHQR